MMVLECFASRGIYTSKQGVTLLVDTPGTATVLFNGGTIGEEKTVLMEQWHEVTYRVPRLDKDEYRLVRGLPQLGWVALAQKEETLTKYKDDWAERLSRQFGRCTAPLLATSTYARWGKSASMYGLEGRLVRDVVSWRVSYYTMGTAMIRHIELTGLPDTVAAMMARERLDAMKTEFKAERDAVVAHLLGDK